MHIHTAYTHVHAHATHTHTHTHTHSLTHTFIHQLVHSSFFQCIHSVRTFLRVLILMSFSIFQSFANNKHFQIEFSKELSHLFITSHFLFHFSFCKFTFFSIEFSRLPTFQVLFHICSTFFNCRSLATHLDWSLAGVESSQF